MSRNINGFNLSETLLRDIIPEDLHVTIDGKFVDAAFCFKPKVVRAGENCVP